MLDTTKFVEDVSDDTGHDLEVQYEGDDPMDDHYEHITNPMMDMIQTLWVSAAESANDCAQVTKKTPQTPTKFGEP